jgi:hypothetical protein
MILLKWLDDQLLRHRRQSELDQFRVGLGKLATQVDLTVPSGHIELQIADLVSSQIDPAVHDLEAALSASRRDVVKKLGDSPKYVAATIPFVISVAAGAPMDVQAALACIGSFAALVGPWLSAQVERSNLLHASQWSILLRLKKHRNKY